MRFLKKIPECFLIGNKRSLSKVFLLVITLIFCDYPDYEVLIMSQVTEWLTSSSSATSLFFATSPIIASRRDKNLSCRQKIGFFHEHTLHSQSFRCNISLYIISYECFIWYLATKLHETLIDSPELEVISIVQRANLLKFCQN